MNYQMFFYVLLVLVFYCSFAARKMRYKIRCRYTSKSLQTQSRDVDNKMGFVLFDKKKFYIVPTCVTHNWLDENLHWLFPTFLPEMSFKWNSEFPIDPKTGEPVVLSPETAAIYKEEESYRNYAGGQQNAMSVNGGGGKLKGLDKFLPWIAIAGVALVAVYFYSQLAPIKSDMNIVKLNLQTALTELSQLGAK